MQPEKMIQRNIQVGVAISAAVAAALGAFILLRARDLGSSAGADPPRRAVHVITHGGICTGTWSSDDPDVPVLRIDTTEPVTIDHCVLSGRGPLIVTGVAGVRVTIHDTRGTALPPGVTGRAPGRFFSGESCDSVFIENNDLDHTAGIYLLGFGSAAPGGATIRILRNEVRDIDGRTAGPGGRPGSTQAVQFVQLDKVRHVPDIEIAWNRVINKPGDSAVEDVINIYNSSGTERSPIRIHDNWIQGAYPADPTQSDYSGGGIMLGDGSAADPEQACAFVEAYANQVIDTTNYGIAISAGHDCVIRDNCVLSSGTLPNGTPLPAQNVGIYIWNAHHPPATFFHNRGFANQAAWLKGSGRNDWWVPDADEWRDNQHLPASAARAIGSERIAWERKLQLNRIRIGAE